MKITLARLPRDFTTGNKQHASLHGLRDVYRRYKLFDLWLRLYSAFYTFWRSPRLRLAMFVLVVLVPLTKFIYLLLPNGQTPSSIEFLNQLNDRFVQTGVGSVWESLSSYAFAVGELLSATLAIFGVFLLFPTNYYPAYLLGFPLGSYLGNTLYRLFYYTDPKEYDLSGSPVLDAVCIVGCLVFLVALDQLVYRKKEKVQSVEARIIGLIRMPFVKWQAKEPLIRQEVDKFLQRDNELFNKNKG